MVGEIPVIRALASVGSMMVGGNTSHQGIAFCRWYDGGGNKSYQASRQQNLVFIDLSLLLILTWFVFNNFLNFIFQVINSISYRLFFFLYLLQSTVLISLYSSIS